MAFADCCRVTALGFGKHDPSTNDSAARRRAALLLACGLPAAVLAGWRGAALAGTATLRRWSGRRVPLFALDDASGRRHALADLRGRIVIVHFFATWCAPCIVELPALQRVARRLDARPEAARSALPVAVVVVDMGEGPARVERFARENAIDLPILLDRDRAVSKAWGIDGLPASVVLDRDLVPRLAATGELDWDRMDIEGILAGLAP